MDNEVPHLRLVFGVFFVQSGENAKPASTWGRWNPSVNPLIDPNELGRSGCRVRSLRDEVRPERTSSEDVEPALDMTSKSPKGSTRLRGQRLASPAVAAVARRHGEMQRGLSMAEIGLRREHKSGGLFNWQNPKCLRHFQIGVIDLINKLKAYQIMSRKGNHPMKPDRVPQNLGFTRQT